MPQPFKITGTSKFHKSRKKAQLPLLPGDAEILKQIERQREEARQSRAITEPLDYLGPLKDFRPAGAASLDKLDICSVIKSLLEVRWSEFPRNAKGDYSIAPKLVAEVAEYRKDIPNVVSMSQIYGLYPNRTTQVDRAVSEASIDGRIRLLSINDADGTLDLAMESAEFYRHVDPVSSELGSLCRKRPDARWFNIKDLLEAKVDVAIAVREGFLVVDPGKAGVHSLSVPGQGRLLKLIRQCRAWLLKTLTQGNRKFKELPESLIKERLESTKKYWSQLRGASLEWILYDSIGSGYIDGFNTPVGRGWKVLRT